jgi:hypothetical protein
MLLTPAAHLVANQFRQQRVDHGVAAAFFFGSLLANPDVDSNLFPLVFHF